MKIFPAKHGAAPSPNRGGSEKRSAILSRLTSRKFLILLLLFSGWAAWTIVPSAGAPGPYFATPGPPRYLEAQYADSTFPFVRSQLLAESLARVRTADVLSLMEGLTGKSPLIIGGQSFLMTTRNSTYTNPYLTKATQYIYESFQTLSLTVSYQEWNQGFLSGRNVIGELRGRTHPEQIVLVTAHLDDMPRRVVAPGADDNASGSAGVILAARHLSAMAFQRTVRFLLLTGEEDGLYGSKAYSRRCRQMQESVIAVYNMDMIGWDDNADGALTLYTRPKSMNGYSQDIAITEVFLQVIATYGNLNQRVKATVRPHEDLAWEDFDIIPFWNQGMAGITAFEDEWEEYNPNYHTPEDTVETLNLNYLTGNIQASIGTVAHLAIPLVSMATTVPPSTSSTSTTSTTSTTSSLRTTSTTSTTTGTTTSTSSSTGSSTTSTSLRRIFLPLMNRNS